VVGREAGHQQGAGAPQQRLGPFRGYALIERQTPQGRVAQATQLREQQQILVALGFPTPAQLLAEILPPLPHV
jgi:hypothetical protein